MEAFPIEADQGKHLLAGEDMQERSISGKKDKHKEQEKQDNYISCFLSPFSPYRNNAHRGHVNWVVVVSPLLFLLFHVLEGNLVTTAALVQI